jgi:glycosyltransferase involved in cell wall biosynthesis
VVNGGVTEQSTDTVRVSVVMPIYNEEETLEAIVRRVKHVAPDVELVAVDDGSVDRSREILARLEAEGLVDRVTLHDQNRGKGAALSTGFRVATGDVVIVQDADLEYDPAEYPVLLAPILDNRAETNLNLTDMETCYKCFRREVLDRLTVEERAFGVEPELTAKIALGGWRVYEVGISYAGRTYAEGKKITWRDGMSAFRCIVKYGLVRRWSGRGIPMADAPAIEGSETPTIERTA